ncbi:MAG: hypothetical protein HRU38_23280 [Saccharospirillaceae bacterium]|nr:hypothetical protein [Saccharospirillaceae bacterium]
MAVYCALTANILNQCGDDFPLAGVGNIYLVPARQLDASATVFGTTTHDITAVAVQGGGFFVQIEGKVSTKDLASENAKDGGGNVHNLTVNAQIPNLDKDKSFLLEEYGNQKLVVIAELYELAASGNRKAVVIGLDKKMGLDAGATLSFNTVSEAEQGGVNGYNTVITAVQGESVRFFTGAIVVEDGGSGTTVNLG